MQYKLRIRPVFPKAPSVHVAVAARRSPFWREAGLTAARLPLNAEGEIHPALNLSQSAHHMRESGCFLGSPFSATPVFFLLKILNGVGQWGDSHFAARRLRHRSSPDLTGQRRVDFSRRQSRFAAMGTFSIGLGGALVA